MRRHPSCNKESIGARVEMSMIKLGARNSESRPRPSINKDCQVFCFDLGFMSEENASIPFDLKVLWRGNPSKSRQNDCRTMMNDSRLSSEACAGPGKCFLASLVWRCSLLGDLQSEWLWVELGYSKNIKKASGRGRNEGTCVVVWVLGLTHSPISQRN